MRFKRDHYILLSGVAALLLAGCGGGGGLFDGGNGAGNLAPTADAGPDKTIDVNNTAIVAGHGTDPDGSIVEYRWSEGGTVLSVSSGSGVLDYIPRSAGDHQLTLTVKDDAGASASDTVIIHAVTPSGANTDSDDDFIPDDVEAMLGTDSTDPDQDNDGVKDGIQSDGTFGDPLFKHQWHIYSTGENASPNSNSKTVAGNDLHLLDLYHKYMGYNGGDPLVVQVVDTGVDYNHTDLSDNMDLSLSRDCRNHQTGNPAESGESDHGTMCSGIIAARGFNAEGVRGIAPFAKLAVSNWLSSDQSQTELEESWTRNDPNGKIVLASNSWGTEGASPDTFFEDLMKYASENLRIVNGVAKGKLFLKAAGNGRGDHHDSGLSYASSNPYVITVAGVTAENKYASYSSPGSNILVSGYSGNFFQDSATIGTTFITGRATQELDPAYDQNKGCFVRASDGACTMPTWNEDGDLSYTYGMNGTSAATPTVAGALTLVLEACPDLGWRDVKHLIATTALKVDAGNPTWVTNGAGLHHSVDYGFGLINAEGMIRECRNGYQPLPAATDVNETFDPDPDIPIPDNDPNGISYQFTVTQNKTIEWIGVWITSDHTFAGDLEIYLTSPAGTTTRLMLGENTGGPYDMSQGFRYGSVAFMDENSSGTWTLRIADKAAQDTGSLQKVTFEVFGH